MGKALGLCATPPAFERLSPFLFRARPPRLFLPEQVTLNLNYRFTSTVQGDDNNGFTDVPPYHRLDFTASKRFYKERFEIMGGISDLLNSSRDAVRGVGSSTFHETPGRNAFLRFQLKF